MEIASLVKIGQKKYMRRLIEEGEIFMNSISYFQKIEDEELRGDKDEGIAEISQVEEIEIFKEGRKIGIAEAGQLRLRDDGFSGNLYSMLSIPLSRPIESKRFKPNIHPRNKEFGDSFVIIFQPKLFINRIEAELKARKFEFQFDTVRYYDKRIFTGKLNVFRKPKEFACQREFRFFVKRQLRDPLCIKIGSITNISKLLDIDAITQLELEKI